MKHAHQVHLPMTPRDSSLRPHIKHQLTVVHEPTLVSSPRFLSSRTIIPYIINGKIYEFMYFYFHNPYVLTCTLRSHGPSGVCGPLHFVSISPIT
jgi:hypothetical protein